jgi:hypothetical protein
MISGQSYWIPDEEELAAVLRQLTAKGSSWHTAQSSQLDEPGPEP